MPEAIVDPELGWVTIVKGNDESRATAGLTPDAVLRFPAGASAVYVLDAWIIYSGPPATDLEWRFAYPGGETIYAVEHCYTSADTVNAFSAVLGPNTIIVGTDTAKRQFRARGWVAVWSTGGGEIIFTWRGANDSVNPVTVHAGSRLRYRRLL